jgi:Tfp pilus assembly protein PilV
MGLLEVLVAMTLMGVGMLAVAGISMQVATQNRWSNWQTDQSLAAQEVLERVQRAGYEAAASGTDTVTVGNRTYNVQRNVTTIGNRVKEVTVTVIAPKGNVRSRDFTTRVYQARQLPTPPVP